MKRSCDHCWAVSQSDNPHLMLLLMFKHILLQANHSLHRHLEYLIAYVLKRNKTWHFYNKLDAHLFAITSHCFSPKHRFLPLQLSKVSTHFTWK